MGAKGIIVQSEGRSIREAFNRSQRNAELEGGNDICNNSINNCHLARDVTRKRKEFDSEDDFIEWMLNNTKKGMVYGYCKQKPILNKNKIKSQVEKFPKKRSRKFETRYVAEPRFGKPLKIPIVEKTQSEAIKQARKTVEANPDLILDIYVKKIITEGNVRPATVKYKPSSNEKDGVYLFAGYALY